MHSSLSSRISVQPREVITQESVKERHKLIFSSNLPSYNYWQFIVIINVINRVVEIKDLNLLIVRRKCYFLQIYCQLLKNILNAEEQYLF